MTQPICPPRWVCNFTPQKQHYIGPWYEGPWGIVVALCAVAAVAAIIITLAYYWRQSISERREMEAQQRQRNHRLAIEEQRTMQLDAAKGNAELLKIIREDKVSAR